MKVAFRVDASLQIGSGHVMRCLTLAQALADKGMACHFICREHPGHLLDLISSKGFKAHTLSAPVTGDDGSQSAITESGQALTHAHWLGASQVQDAAETSFIIQRMELDWLVVDHYALDSTWEEILRPFYKRLMVIDDLADRRHVCDLLLDQNLGRKEQDYLKLVSTSCKVMVGPQYALLRPEFYSHRKTSLNRRKQPAVRQILISMGGVDPDNVTGRVLSALRQCVIAKDCRFVIVMGAKAPWLQQVKEQAASLPWVSKVLVNIQDMAKQMSESDLAIGAAGSTSWERCCLGLPSIVVVLAENQRNVADILSERKIALVIDLSDIESEMVKCFESIAPSILNSLTERSIQVTSGDGAEKIVQQLILNLS